MSRPPSYTYDPKGYDEVTKDSSIIRKAQSLGASPTYVYRQGTNARHDYIRMVSIVNQMTDAERNKLGAELASYWAVPTSYKDTLTPVSPNAPSGWTIRNGQLWNFLKFGETVAFVFKHPNSFKNLMNQTCLNANFNGNWKSTSASAKQGVMKVLSRWLNEHNSYAADALNVLCRTGDSMQHKWCQLYCRTKDRNCDERVLQYCADKPDDPFCACVSKSGKYNPRCFVAECRDHGYVLLGQKAQECPAIVDCRIQTELINDHGTNALAGLSIEQNCGNSEYIPPDTTSAAASAAGTGGGSEPDDSSSGSLWLMLFFFMVVILGAIIAGVFYLKSSLVPAPATVSS